MIENRKLFDKIAESLIAEYVRVYLVNIETNEYCRYFVDQDSHFLNRERRGDDFFRDIAGDVGQLVYEEDKHFF